MRKTSDIAMLLGSSSKSRSRGSRKGFVSSFLGVVDTMLGRAGKGRRKKRATTVSTTLFSVGLLVAFGGGFFVGGAFGGDSGDNALSARVPSPNGATSIGVAPEFLHEVDTTKLADWGYVVTAYKVTENQPEPVARQRAVDLANYLQEHGLQKARPRSWGPGLWVTVVYFEGRAEQDGTRDQLLNMPEDVPDVDFCQRREESDWPTAYEIQ